MSTLSLRFPTGTAQVGGFDSLAKTLQACSKVAATLEHGQRLQNLSERLFFIQKPANALPPDPDQDTQPHLDFSSTGRPRRISSIPLSKTSGKRSDSYTSSPRKSQNAVKLSSIFNDDFSPTALLSSASNISNTVEIPLDELFAPDATDGTSPVAAKPVPVQSTSSKRNTTSTTGTTLKRSSSSTAASQTAPGTSVNAADIAGVNGKAMCANCGATHTPLWRRGLNDELNCNACGLYCKLHKRPRPKVMKITSIASPRPAPYTPPPPTEAAPVAAVSAVCHNCKTTTTPLWRKNDAGQNVCNACGLYHKLHGEARPVSMKSDVVRKRSRQEAAARTPKSMPLPAQRDFPKVAPTGLKVNTTPVSYERSSSLSAGATPRKGSFASDDDDEDLARKEREAAAAGLKLSDIRLLQSTLHELQRRGDHSNRNSEYGDMTDGEGYGSDEAHSRKRRRQEDDDYESYERRPSYDARARARLGPDYGRPSPLRQLVEGPIDHHSYGRHEPVYTQQRAQSPFSASSSESSSPRTVERDLPMSQPYSPTQPAVAVDGYYAHGYYPKDVNPAYARAPSGYDYDYRNGVPRKYRRQTMEMV